MIPKPVGTGVENGKKNSSLVHAQQQDTVPLSPPLSCSCFCPSCLIWEATNIIECERFEPRSHFKSRLSLIVRVNVVLNRTVVVADSD